MSLPFFYSFLFSFPSCCLLLFSFLFLFPFCAHILYSRLVPRPGVSLCLVAQDVFKNFLFPFLFAFLVVLFTFLLVFFRVWQKMPIFAHAKAINHIFFGMKKYILDLIVRQSQQPRPGYVLLRLTDPSHPLPAMLPGQFVEVRVDGSPSTFLRRPISINLVDKSSNELWLLVHAIGAGTRALANLKEGDSLNVVLPLGNGFTLPAAADGEGAGASLRASAVGTSAVLASPRRYLLVGGGVGTAPLLYLGQELVARGWQPVFLLGGRSAGDLLQLDDFRALGEVHVTTEDGTLGEQGFVTQHSLWLRADADGFARVCTCGPKPMMVAVARLAREKGIPCEASLENLMACGLGACLCCVEDTVDGHVCVCKEGPVFNIEKLKW